MSGTDVAYGHASASKLLTLRACPPPLAAGTFPCAMPRAERPRSWGAMPGLVLTQECCAMSGPDIVHGVGELCHVWS
eukprot:2813224-Rhodomonas_salina.2